MSRKAIRKSVRFEVFKRDNFTCQYCGSAAPDVVLHLDHINPVAGGGDNDIINLITSCQPCNQGKGARTLDDKSAIEKQRKQLAELNERREQLEMMLRWRDGLSDIEELKVEAFNKAFGDATGCSLNDHGKAKLRRWLKHNTIEALLEGLDNAIGSYYKNGDDDPEENNRMAGEAFSKVLSVIRGKKKYADKPHMRDLFYIRGIVRNRGHCNDLKAIELLEAAYGVGIHIDDLKQLALNARNWTDWRDTMIEWIYGEEGE
jgi:hypothetical protein